MVKTGIAIASPLRRLRIDRGALPVANTPYIPGDAVRVWPIGLDSDGGKRFLSDEPFGDFSPFPIELVCAMGRLTQGHKTCLTNALHQRVAICGRSAEGVGAPTHTIDQSCGHLFYAPAVLPHRRPWVEARDEGPLVRTLIGAP
jgi:hypothetical protein